MYIDGDDGKEIFQVIQVARDTGTIQYKLFIPDSPVT